MNPNIFHNILGNKEIRLYIDIWEQEWQVVPRKKVGKKF